MKAKKKFGQNFLTDKSVLDRIIGVLSEVIQSKPKLNIVEIGLGLGDLTQRLLEFSQNLDKNFARQSLDFDEKFNKQNLDFDEKFKKQNLDKKSQKSLNFQNEICDKMRIFGYEIDSDLIPILKAKFQKQLNEKRLVLHCEDASLRRNLCESDYILVANLPYYIATHLILQALEDDFCTEILVMVQKEVALKFCAKSGESDFCALSILSALCAKREFLFEIPPQAFKPQPKVDSAVILMKKFRRNLADFYGFKAFLKDCFKAPRKQLLVNLKPFKAQILPVFLKRNLAQNARAHELCVDDLLEIYEKIKDHYEWQKHKRRCEKQ